jgi:hAT family C-terminal dimerisation region
MKFISFSRNAGNENPFAELAEFAISLLVLPFSNADVERIFSLMNNIKTKLRNKMSTDMLTSIMHVRSGLRRRNVCCSNLDITSKMVEQIGTSTIYDHKKKQDASCGDDENEFDHVFSLLNEFDAYE